MNKMNCPYLNDMTKNLEEMIINKLQEKKYTVSTAESCTGGLVAATIVNVSGASNVFNEGYVTYSNEAKKRLTGVRQDTLDRLGAVSEEVAVQMAEGCAKAADANMGISTTGIAGPDGGTKQKPVGLVYIGCTLNGKTKVTKNIFNGDRTQVRNQSVQKALKMAMELLDE